MASDNVSVLTYNIRLETSKDAPHDLWSGERRTEVVQFLLGADADVIGLQEVSPGQLAFLAKALSPKYIYVGTGRDRDGRGEASPIFISVDRFKVECAETYWLPETPYKAGTTLRNAKCPRVVTCASLRQSDGRGLCVCCTHLDHNGMSGKYPVQREQAKILLSLVDDFCPRDPAIPCVVLGDFNSWRRAGAPPVLQSAGYFDCSRGDDTRTFVGFAAGRKSQNPERHIDWIFLRGGTCVDYRIYDPSYRHPRGGHRNASDHLPVGAILHLGAEGPSRTIGYRTSDAPRAGPCCSTDGCPRQPWNGWHGESCCRTCGRSGGEDHGPDCSKKWKRRHLEHE